MREYTVQKSNIFSYRGNDYSLPSGTYQGPKTKVWVNNTGSRLEIYSKSTGKLLHVHDVPKGKGQYVLASAHRRTVSIACKAYEKEIMEYCNYDEMAMLWMANLKKDKPRYYTQNLCVLIKGMRHFAPATLRNAFEKCVDSSMYNAKDFISLCERIGRRQPVRPEGKPLADRLPDAARETPARTDISQYNQYFS